MIYIYSNNKKVNCEVRAVRSLYKQIVLSKEEYEEIEKS